MTAQSGRRAAFRILPQVSRRALLGAGALAGCVRQVCPAAQSGAELETAERLIAETAARYRRMGAAVSVRALVHRRVGFGGRWQETRREWELLQGPGGLLARGWDRSGGSGAAGQGFVLYARRGSEVLLYFSTSGR